MFNMSRLAQRRYRSLSTLCSTSLSCWLPYKWEVEKLRTRVLHDECNFSLSLAKNTIAQHILPYIYIYIAEHVCSYVLPVCRLKCAPTTMPHHCLICQSTTTVDSVVVVVAHFSPVDPHPLLSLLVVWQVCTCVSVCVHTLVNYILRA